MNEYGYQRTIYPNQQNETWFILQIVNWSSKQRQDVTTEYVPVVRGNKRISNKTAFIDLGLDEGDESSANIYHYDDNLLC